MIISWLLVIGGYFMSINFWLFVIIGDYFMIIDNYFMITL